MKEVSSEEWDACALSATGPDSDNPFLSHAFLSILEDSGSVCQGTGWQSCHILARDQAGKLVGCCPVYIKSHSYGEYVFDHSWARAHFSYTGKQYYPKLQSCVPFTPVMGPRLLALGAKEKDREGIRATMAKSLRSLSEQLKISSAHVTFLSKDEWAQLGREEGYVQRVGMQYHWHNSDHEGHKYDSFDAFLAELKQSRRKSIRQERKKVGKAGIIVKRLTGKDIEERHWKAFYKFYLNTVDAKWGQAYLTREFFTLLGQRMADKVLLVVAEEEKTGELVAGALNMIGGDCLYGRNWGCSKQYDSLHFELCYYQAIDEAIERGLRRVEAGAQGQHKISRGYLPTLTYSSHFLRDPKFGDAVRGAMAEEQQQILYTTAMLTIQESPFKEDPTSHLASQGILIEQE